MYVRHMCTRVYFIYIYIVIIIIRSTQQNYQFALLRFLLYCAVIYVISFVLRLSFHIHTHNSQLTTHNSQLADYVHYITLRWLLTYYLLPYLYI